MYYKGIGPEDGTIVNEGDAYVYALERCLGGASRKNKKNSGKCWWNGIIPEIGLRRNDLWNRLQIFLRTMLWQRHAEQ